MLMKSLGPAFDVTKKILASVEDLTYDKTLAQLKEEEQAMKRRTTPGASLATAYFAGIPISTRCFECGSVEHCATKCPSRKWRRGGNGNPNKPDGDSNGTQDQRPHKRQKKQRQRQ